MPFYTLLPLFAFFFNACLLFLLLRVKRKTPAHRVFSLYLLSMILWAGTIYGMRSSPDLERAFQWERFVLPIFPATTIFIYHFTLLFTHSKKNLWVFSALYLLFLLLVAIAPTPLVLRGMQLRPYGYAPIIGPLFFPWVAGVYFPYLLAFSRLIPFARTAPSYKDRNRASYLIVGTAIGFLGATTDYLAALRLFPYPGGIIANLLFALIATVAVMRHKLLDMRLVLRKGLGYLLATVLIIVPYFGVVVTVNRAAPMLPYALYINIALLLILAAILHPLLSSAQDLAGRLFYQKRYDYLQALQHFSREASNILDFEQLSTSLIEKVGLALQTDRVYLLLFSPGKNMQSTVLPVSQKLVWQEDSPLAMELRKSDEPLNWEDLESNPRLQALSQAERESLERMEVELLVPLKVNEKLIGMLVLGPRRTGQLYSQEDAKLLMKVASQAAMAIENAQLYVWEKERVAELQHLDQLKSDFFLAAAHHLKTPITIIKASLGMLEELEKVKQDKDERHSRLVSSVSHGAETLEREISELLDFLKIRANSVELHPQPIDLREFLINASAELLPALKKKKQSLDLDLPDQFPKAMLDLKCLERILFNLLTNAHKFAPEGGFIRIILRLNEGELLVAVKDNGPGIPREEQKSIFDAYYQLKGSAGAGMGSIGLGLAISKSLVELQGGRIWVESKVGEGSTFSFTLPLVKAASDES